MVGRSRSNVGTVELAAEGGTCRSNGGSVEGRGGGSVQGPVKADSPEDVLKRQKTRVAVQYSVDVKVAE